MDDTHLCFKAKRYVAGKHHAKEQDYFTIYNLEKDEVVWTVNDAERVFFKITDDIDDEEAVEFEVNISGKKEESDDGSD